MALRIEEYDYGSKGKAKKKIEQMLLMKPEKFKAAIFAWWKKVYTTALEEVPVDTGALRNTIRIIKGEDNSKTYNVAKGLADQVSEYRIQAGGFGIINPKNKREVDYAKAVHDGYKNVPANPFLTRAMAKNERLLEDDYLKKYMDWMEREWASDQNYPKVWKQELVVKIR